MKKNIAENDAENALNATLERVLRMVEVKKLCGIVGLTLAEAATVMGITADTLGKAIIKARETKNTSFLPLVLHDALAEKVIDMIGRELLAQALEEIETGICTRLLWSDAKKVLQIAGIPVTRLATQTQLSHSVVYDNINWRGNRPMPLRDIHALKIVLGERNFDRAVKMLYEKKSV